MNIYRRIVINFIILATSVYFGLIGSGARLIHHYKGVDPEVSQYVAEWIDLADQRGLKFDKEVTVGFKTIDLATKTDVVVAICNRGPWVREIDINSKYWPYMSKITQSVTLWHELVHCYCDRGHDYRNIEYGSDIEAARKDPSKVGGFYPDKCPKSIMFPEIVEDSCFMVHYQEYVNEMLDGCEPY